MGRRWSDVPPLTLLLSAALVLLLAHASPETDALGEKLEQTQDPGVAKHLNDLFAWSIGENMPSSAPNQSPCPVVDSTFPQLPAGGQTA
jgi:hypothetical protein